MSKAKSPDAPPDKVELYEKLVATHSEIERKGAGIPYTSLNGHMFSYLNAAGTMALKLPKAEIEKFLAKYDAKLMEAYGIIQKEYISVPDSLLENTEELKPYLAMSFDYVKTLKPKPTKKGE